MKSQRGKTRHRGERLPLTLIRTLTLTLQEAAEKVNSRQVHVLVDMMGHTRFNQIQAPFPLSCIRDQGLRFRVQGFRVESFVIVPNMQARCKTHEGLRTHRRPSRTHRPCVNLKTHSWLVSYNSYQGKWFFASDFRVDDKRSDFSHLICGRAYQKNTFLHLICGCMNEPGKWFLDV